MVVVLVLACLAVLGAVVVLAMGRGGELSAARRDHPPLPPPDDHPFTGPEPFALPRSLWGYQVEATDEAMERFRHALYERDARLAALEHQVSDLQGRLERAEEVAEDEPPPPVDLVKDPADHAENNGAAADRDEARQ